MSSLTNLQRRMIALFDADLAELRRVCEELRALGEREETSRIEQMIDRNQQICDGARASLARLHERLLRHDMEPAE